MTRRLTESLGIPLWLAIIIAIPGLFLFVGIFAFATYSGLTETLPNLSGTLTICLSITLPIVAFVVIIAASTIQAAKKSDDPNWRWVFRVGRALGWVIGVIAVAAYIYLGHR